MIVLHAFWNHDNEGRLYLWAEDSHLLAQSATRAPATRKKIAHPHPFSLASQDLQELVSELYGSLPGKEASSVNCLLRLPATTKGPLASPELLAEQRNIAGLKVNLQTWQVSALCFTPGTALDLLLALPEHAAHGHVFSSELRFWSTVAKFALELLYRQSFTPALQRTKQGRRTLFQACWQPVLAAEDDARMRQLAAMMPPACWSFLLEETLPALLPLHITRHFLNRVIDAFVRESLVTTTLLPSRRSRVAARSLPEQWLQALASPTPTLDASDQELRTFEQTLQVWLGQLQLPDTTAPFRTCFRLDEPPEQALDLQAQQTQEDTSTAGWRISYYLQANNDRSLLVPADKVWAERSGALTFLKHRFENPQERLLADLARASRVFPDVEESLKAARPAGLQLTTEQAYRFLRETAPLLEQSGFGVLIPSWWQKRQARIGVKLRVKPQVGAVVSRSLMDVNSLVNYDWSVAIGDTALSAREFEQLVNLKMPLVQIRGQWVELRPEQIEAALNFFTKKKHARQQMRLSEAMRIGLGQETGEAGLPVIDIEGEGWLGEMLSRLTQQAGIETVTIPETFQGKLRPYQLRGVSWLAFLSQCGFGACLADDMGLGKTPSMIAELLYHQYTVQTVQHPVRPSLVICPMSILGNWQRELQRFAPSLKVMVHHGAERLSEQAFIDETHQHDVVITTYSLAYRDREHLTAVEWEHVVIDEAQNIKNESAKQTQAIKQLQAAHRIALTGTPVENRLSELWSIMEFLNPGYLGSGSDFRRSFAIPIERYHNAERSETLKRLIQPFVLRRLKTDRSIINDLPDKLEMKVLCNLTQEQASLYEAVVKEMMEKIKQADGIERKGLILGTLTRLKQICNHPAQYMGDSSSLPHRSGKLARLEEMLEEVTASGEKALIFTQYAEMGGLLQRYLQDELGYETLFLHGGVNKKQRDLLVQRFQEERRGAPLFVLSLKAGGVGLNLTAGNHVFHFDRWWNPAVENQATDRAFRIGQTKQVQVHKFVCVGTMEERIDAMIEQKKVLAESIVGSGENWLTEMSTEQLKELFTLSRDAIAE